VLRVLLELDLPVSPADVAIGVFLILIILLAIHGMDVRHTFSRESGFPHQVDTNTRECGSCVDSMRGPRTQCAGLVL
jgi:hypothetical protein